MARLFLGLIKGAVLGGAVGYGAYAAGLDAGALLWIVYGVLGVVIGLLCGRPLWSHIRDSSSTMWTSILKALFGAGVAIGLFAIARRTLGGFELTMLGDTRALPAWTPVLGGAIGALYGAFIEVDDAAPKKGDEPAPKQLPKKR